MTTSIAEYSPTAAALADLEHRMANVVYDVSTPKGMAAAKADRAEVRDLRIALEKKRVEIKEPALTRCREIDSEAKRITAALQKYEDAADAPIKAHEAKIEAERQAKVRAEQERIAAIDRRIAHIRGSVSRAGLCSTLDEVQLIARDIESTDTTKGFDEHAEAAAIAKREALAGLDRAVEAFRIREAEAERLAKERAELARQRAEQDEANRVERERIAEADRQARAEQDRIAAEQRAESERLAAERRKLEAEQQRRDDEAHAKQAAEERAERERQAEAERLRKANFVPTLAEMTAVLSDHYERSADVIDGWLRDAYSGKKKAA